MTGQDLHPADSADDDILAAEFALGVLDDDSHRAAARRVEADAAFASRVADWEALLGPLVDEIAPVAAPAGAWGAIETRFGWRSAPEARSGLWHSLAFWRVLGLGSSAIAALALVALVSLPREGPGGQAGMAAVLAAEDGRSAYAATLDRSGRITLIPVADTALPQGRVHELWVIGTDGVPASLGTVSPQRPTTMPVPPRLMPMAGGLGMAVSLEPDGGSPTGQPTGPVVAQGMIREL